MPVLLAALDNPVDLLFLLLVALLIFGKQLPEVARSIGKGIRELKESVNLSEVNEAMNSVHEVRRAVSPGAIARAAIPGLAEFQDSAVSARAAMDPTVPRSPTPGVVAPAPLETPPAVEPGDEATPEPEPAAAVEHDLAAEPAGTDRSGPAESPPAAT